MPHVYGIRRDMENKKALGTRKKIICDLVKDPIYVPMKEKELAVFLQVAREDREELRAVLRELLAEGKLMLTAKGKYVKSNGRLLAGTFTSNAPFTGTRWKWHCSRSRRAGGRRQR